MTSNGLSGNQKRKMKSAARLYAVQALFQMEHSALTVDVVRHEFIDHRFGAIYEGDEMLEGDVDLFSRILEDAVNYQAPIDQMANRAIVAKWAIARIDPTLCALFRAAGAEPVPYTPLTLPTSAPVSIPVVALTYNTNRQHAPT